MGSADYQELVAAHRDRVFTFAMYTLRHREDAEDVTQDVLIRLWHHCSRLDADRVGAWLARVTRNACYDLTRRRKVRRAVHPADPGPQLEIAKCADPTPESSAEASEFKRRLEIALDSLEDPYRSIVILREIQGLSYQEIAEAVERPLNTVKVYLHRARRMLRHALAEEEAHVRAS